MSKAIEMPGVERSGIAELIDTIERLGHANQERMLRIVILLADAPHAVQQAVQDMLGHLLARPPESAGDCIAEIEAMIEYLETSTGDDDRNWDAPRAAALRAVVAGHRFN